MNICVFGASFLPRRGGMEYVIHYLANALVRKGHEVTVIAARVDWRGVGIAYDYNLVRYGLPVRGLGRLGINRMLAIFSFWRRHRKKPFDILHCHGVSYAGSRAVAIKNLFKIPLIMTPHGQDIQRVPEIGYGLRLNKKWDAVIRHNIKCADAVTAISLSVENELDFIDASKVVRIPNGVNVRCYGKSKSNYLRDRLGVSAVDTLILSVGRNHPKKGYEYGIQAISVLKKKYNQANMHYVIIGRGVTEHESLVTAFALQQSVSLIEEVSPEQLRECYQSADIFFSPSIIEGLSLVSIEAISCGLPLVVTDVPGNKDIVLDTGAGIIVHDKDPESMAEGLRELLNQADKRALLSERAIKESAQYDWGNIANKYLEVYQRESAKNTFLR